MSEHLIDNLPEELLIQILSLLEPSELRQAGRVCRTWRRIVTDDSCWRRAFARTFTQRPFERLMPNRMPAKAGSSQSLVTSGRGSASSWQFEYLHRQRLIRQWQSIGGNGQTRLEYNVRASSVDKVIVSEKYGWALAVSMAGKVAIRSMPMTGKVFARDNDIHDIVFALPHVSEPGHWIDQGRASSLSTRIDRIVWGFDDGVVTVTHINKFGRLQSRTISGGSHVGPVLGSAGPLDQLTQHQHEWPAAYDIAGDDRVVASAGADGDVRVWSEDTGDLVCVLRGVFGTPLVKVSWAEGLHYVVAASSSGAVFVWDFEEAKTVTMETDYDYSEPVDTSAPPVRFEKVPWLTPALDEYSNARSKPMSVFPIPGATGSEPHSIVELVGDPYSKSLIIATEKGVWRMSIEGDVLATFTPHHHHPDLPSGFATVSAVKWNSEDGSRRVPGISRAPSRSESDVALSKLAANSDRAVTKESSTVLRLNLSHAAPPSAMSTNEVETRLLLVGDAAGSLWMFDSDATGIATPIRAWPRLHRFAVSALSINGCMIVSAARNGQVFIIDPLTGQPLRAMRCRGGGRGDRRNRRRREHNNQADDHPAAVADRGPRRLDPWFWSIHPAVMNSETRNDIFLAQLLASRTSEQWGFQLRNRTVDTLDRTRVDNNADIQEFFRRSQFLPNMVHAFPTLVSDVASGYGWVVLANGTRLQTAFVGQGAGPHSTAPRHGQSGSARRTASALNMEEMEQEVEESLEELRLEAELERERRISEYDRRQYIDREFAGPSEELGLNQDEQLEYALWLSSQESKAGPSQIASKQPESSRPDNGPVDNFVFEDMTEEEQLEYALFLSRSASEVPAHAGAEPSGGMQRN